MADRDLQSLRDNAHRAWEEAEKHALTLKGAQVDPLLWCRSTLGFEGWGLQNKIIESVRDNRRTVVKGCHAPGKTKIAASSALWFLSAHPRSLVITTATTQRQVKGVMWREIHQLHSNAIRPLGGDISETRLQMTPDWWAWGFTADEYDPTRFQGFHGPHVMVIVDEAAGVGRGVFEGLEAVMSSGHARMLAIGNPTDPDSEFARMFDRPDIAKFTIDAFDTPNFTELGVTLDDIRQGDGMRSGPWKDKSSKLPLPLLISPEWVREKWLEWCGGRVEGEGDPRWMSRVRAEFPTTAEDALFPSEWVQQAFERHRRLDWTPTPNNPARCRLGCDVARFGKDTTQIAAYFPGWGVRSIQELEHLDTQDTAMRICELASSESLSGNRVEEVRIDADGLGAGVYDAAKRMLDERAVEIRNGSRAQASDRFTNLRSEMLWHLREALDPSGEEPIALPPDEGLLQELRAFRWAMRADGRIAAESKDDVKARIGRSPDKADAVAYAVTRLERYSVEII